MRNDLNEDESGKVESQEGAFELASHFAPNRLFKVLRIFILMRLVDYDDDGGGNDGDMQISREERYQLFFSHNASNLLPS